MLTAHQQLILSLVREKGGRATKEDIVAKFHYWHYVNAKKHIGDTLSRMVNAGLLKRIKPGLYEHGTGTKQKPAVIESDINQVKLF